LKSTKLLEFITFQDQTTVDEDNFVDKNL